MNTDRDINTQIPVSPNEQKPLGCPDHGATSTQNCAGPIGNNEVCMKKCPKSRFASQVIFSKTNLSLPVETL